MSQREMLRCRLPMSAPASSPPHRISVLVFLRDAAGRFLLIRRNKAPNLGCWSPVGGKLEYASGESPFECATREVAEETGHAIGTQHLHLFAMIAEKSYEGTGHWLMFLFDCHLPLQALPPDIDEGRFGFFSREEVESLALPPTDRVLLWPNYDRFRHTFIALRANCHPEAPLEVTVEQGPEA